MSGTRATAEGIGLPFREAIAFFLQKLNRPTQHWTDVWQEGHSRAFMVAGAATDALLSDFRAEISRALEQGTTLAEFRRRFDEIVAKHGWVHNGSPGWRARVIYETNLSTAYAAGRYAQMTEPGTLFAFPYWQYVHSGARNPREQHRAWNGLVLRADDPFWRTHYPPNGWGCGCRVRPLSGRDLARQGKSGPDTAPDPEPRLWTNPRTSQQQLVPKGIDPGFAYNPGMAWQGGRAPELPRDARLRVPPASFPPPPPPAPPLAEPAGGAAPLAARPVVRRDPAPPAVRAMDDVLRGDYAAWGASLSEDELRAIATYRRAGAAFNGLLRGISPGFSGLGELVEMVKAALLRAVTMRALTVLRGASGEEARRVGAVGSSAAFDAFVSASIDPDVARGFAARRNGRIIEIRIPAGARGAAYIHPWPRSRPAQYEVLLAPGMRYRVISRTSRRIVLEVIHVGDDRGGG